MKTLLAVTLLFMLGACRAQNFNVSATIDKLIEGYDKRVRPNWGGPPVDVAVTMYFIGIFNINTKYASIEADFYLRHTWTDNRLAFDAPAGYNTISLGPDTAHRFWSPDTFSPDGDAVFAHDNNLFFRIHRDGSVMKSVRVKTKSKLNMDLHNFPQDQQKFTFSMESYGYSARDIVYSWQLGSDSVGISPNSGSPEVAISHLTLDSQTIRLTSGNYSRLSIDAHLVRRSGYYMRHFYLPAIISFLFAWSTFWFSHEMAIIRVLIILSSFLTGNYLLSQLWDHIPVVDYSTMLEKYIIFVMVMSAIALFECATVLFVERKSRRPKIYEKDLESNLLEQTPQKPKEEEGEAGAKTSGSYIIRSTRYIMTFHQHRRSHKKLDLTFRVLYTIVFVIFNIWYFLAF